MFEVMTSCPVASQFVMQRDEHISNRALERPAESVLAMSLNRCSRGSLCREILDIERRFDSEQLIAANLNASGTPA